MNTEKKLRWVGTRPVRPEGKKNKEEEVTVRPETALQKKGGSAWSWHKEFTVEWSETFLTKKRKKHPRKEE